MIGVNTWESWLTVKRIQFAAIFLAIKGVQQVVTAPRRGTTFHDLLTNAIFRDVVIPLSATIGSYVVASIIHVRGLSLEVHESAIVTVPHIRWTHGT